MGNNTRLNKIYNAMLQRCCNPNNTKYNYYGGRGIKVCLEWLNKEWSGKGHSTKGWVAFKKWSLAHGYTQKLTIDRIDNSKGYSPENCRWVDRKTQNNNTRQNHYVTLDGNTMTVKQMCEKYNIPYKRALRRLQLGWSVKRTFETKDNKNFVFITYRGKTQSLSEWSKELDISLSTLWTRLYYHHWTVEKSFNTN